MPLNITRFFDELGRSIYADWAQQQFNEAAFPSLVEQVLQSQQVHLKLNKEAIINWVLGEQPLSYRSPLNSKFSDLNLTAYANDKFFIELLFWLDGTTTIHQHAFSGAFTVIEGTSIHSDYSFVTQRCINRSLLLGDVQFNAIE
ncbi:MAG: hypothetical protein MJK04_19195, partial [Psychrosphaera sp.]|nr:hypothetical protein [Psychrosphaera sp.]